MKIFGKTVVVIVAAAGGTLLTHGVASATTPSVVGKTYSDTKTALSMAGFTPVLANVIGDKLAQNDCRVINQRDVNTGLQGWNTAQTISNGVFVGGDQPTLYPGPGFGNQPPTGRVYITLSCYASPDAVTSRATGTGDINTKKSSTSSSTSSSS
ncbi:MAG: hypothetical protein JO191_06850 [Mycobacteriaceae bacterium]|nr:hypothetical protein [Mycobacteriaceae bacterium]